MRKAKSPALTYLKFLILPIFVILLALGLIPQCQLSSKKLSSPDKQAEMENAYRATLVQAFGGALFFVTAYFTWCNLQVAEANLKATEEKQVTERFSKAIELLGSEKLEVRLGGIYALERIAKDSPKDYWTIMEVLTSFVREKSLLQQSQSIQGKKASLVESILNEQRGSSPQEQEPQKITTDVQAVLAVIKRRDPSKTLERRINLIGANLSGTSLVGADLTDVILRDAKLIGTDLSRAYLTRANLIGADLKDAKLIGTDLGKAALIGANLIGTNRREANLKNAIFSEADRSRANLSEAELSQVLFLTPEQISAINTDTNIKLPN